MKKMCPAIEAKDWMNSCHTKRKSGKCRYNAITNAKCEIIAKEKDVEVMAWAAIGLSGKIIATAVGGSKYVPCKIVMTAANYRKIKGIK